MKRKTGPKRDPSSLNCRLEAYFERNPSEWLTMEDMVAKFEADRDQIRHAVTRLKRDGRLDLEPVVVYRRVEEQL